MLRKMLCIIFSFVLCFLLIIPSYAEDEEETYMEGENCVTAYIKSEYSGQGRCYTTEDFNMPYIDDIKTFLCESRIPQLKNDIVFIYLHEPVEENVEKALKELEDNELVEETEKGCFDVRIIEISSGDIDGDCKVTAADARQLIRIAVGFDEFPDNIAMFCCDMDHDGAITAEDARLAMRTAVGLELVSRFEYFL